MDKIYRLGELFCGPGGIGVGARDTRIVSQEKTHRIEHCWATDIHEDSCRTYFNNLHSKNDSAALIRDEREILTKKNSKGPIVLCKDVRKINFALLPKVDGLTFGFPCNDFSLVGEQRGISGSYGPLYSFGVKAIRALEPDWFIAENVGGLRSSGKGAALARIYADLQTAGPGYTVTAHYFKFEEYGLPQSRHRFIFVGIRSALGKRFVPPAPTHLDRKDQISAATALAEIDPSALHQEHGRLSDIVRRRLEMIEPGQNVWNAKLTPELRLNVKGAHLSQIYKRLLPNRPAYTITGSGGGGTHVYHWAEARALTNRERAKLQNFPDNYVFAGTRESIRRQIGMAVPPLGAQTILEAVLKTMAGKPYRSIPNNWTAPD